LDARCSSEPLFFRGETLNEETPILVPDTGAEPAALHE
jgi:hypothetical protein